YSFEMAWLDRAISEDEIRVITEEITKEEVMNYLENLSKNIKSPPSGLSKIFGAIAYTEPKIFAIDKYKKDKRSDIYSLGVLFWEISSCCVPFEGIDHIIKMEKIKGGLCEKPISATPLEYTRLYEDCWKPEPEDRPLIEDVCERLKSKSLVLGDHYKM
ncbi:8730_t:CDS:2, partial [Ambispora gerdemannii]